MQNGKMNNSLRLFENLKKVVAGGVNSAVRSVGWTPCPIAIKHATGSTITDVDGNEYIDYNLAYGPLILGHSNKAIKEAVLAQLDKGWLYGAPYELELDLAEKIVKAVPCAESVQLSTSGTRAVLNAIRLARAYTGKEKIVKFEGHFHGGSDDVLWSVGPPLEVIGPERNPIKISASSGIPSSKSEDVIVLPWNNLPALETTIKRCKNDIAAVITEPYLCNCGCIPPNEGYLEALRELTEENDIILIFDEVITGFRLALGGAQEYFGITPDLVTLGKALGGGFPISAVAGRQDLMELVASRKVFFGGTFNGSSVCVAASLATLTELEKGYVYEHINNIGGYLIKELNKLFEDYGIEALVQGHPSVWSIFFTGLEQVRNYREACTSDAKKHLQFQRELLTRGVYTHPSAREHCFISAAHTKEQIEKTIEAAEDVLKKSGKMFRAESVRVVAETI